MTSLQVRYPRSLTEALNVLNECQSTGRVIAGGTDLLVHFRNNLLSRSELTELVDLSRVEELRGFEMTTTRFHVGPLVTFADLCMSPLVNREAPLLAEMARQMGSPQIRNRATIGGNLVNAAICADGVPPLMALSTQVTLTSVEGTRILPLNEFIKGSGCTAILPNEILTNLSFERLPDNAMWGFTKLGRRKSAAISRVSIAVIRLVKPAGEDSSCRVAVGAVTPLPMRLKQTEQFLEKNGWGHDSVLRAASTARAEVESISGSRWSSAYKLPVLESLLLRTLSGLKRWRQ